MESRSIIEWTNKALTDEEFDLWYRSNNIVYEKFLLFGDFMQSLFRLMKTTYLGDKNVVTETTITLTKEEQIGHFLWCWGRIVDNFKKEGIFFNYEGEHRDFCQSLFTEVFYNDQIGDSDEVLTVFFGGLFDPEIVFSKFDINFSLEMYRLFEKNLNFRQ